MCQFVNLVEMHILLIFTYLCKLKKKYRYPQPLVFVNTDTSYQSQEMLTWQTSCTRKEVLRKMQFQSAIRIKELKHNFSTKVSKN